MESLHSNCFLDKAGFDFDFLTFELLENVDSRRRPALASLVWVFIFKFSAAMTGSRLRFVVSRWSTVEWPNRIRYAVLGRTLSLPCLDDYLAVDWSTLLVRQWSPLGHSIRPGFFYIFPVDRWRWRIALFTSMTCHDDRAETSGGDSKGSIFSFK